MPHRPVILIIALSLATTVAQADATEKELVQVPSSICDMTQVRPISPETRSRLDGDELFARLATLLPEELSPDVERVVETECREVRQMVVVRVQRNGVLLTAWLGIIGIDPQGDHLVFATETGSPGELTLHTEDGEVTIQVNETGIDDVSDIPENTPAESVWQCILDSLRNRTGIDQLPAWAVNIGLCLYLPPPGISCLPIATQVSGLVLGVWWDCLA